MKKVLFGLGLALLVYGGYTAYEFYNSLGLSPRGQATYQTQDITIDLDYGRPYKRGRKVFGGLVQYGEYWRTGANEATEIEFSRDVVFGGKPIKKGRYRLYSIPESARWTIVLNSELAQWGKFEPNYDLDVLRVEVPVLSPKEEVEQLTIEFQPDENGAQLLFKWNRTLTRVPIKWKNPPVSSLK
ncbi:DUF2911 domain-containing protein [uncultured Imperialibacter sp.]|uniref:DUF2911 domain-containing protein n=1 Tax=uncultured Imperialibacter sp. TaxID=1672639 RepID=UPI0030D72ADA|tara:strand:- start:10299 stop:10853 length:555 start_codon:yes stop_codon:yes gene_type:complete